MGIKLTSADKWFGKCIKERASWVCERCHTYYPEGNRQGLHCSHLYGRGSHATRFDVNNAFCHCFGCHHYLGSNPVIFHEWAREQLGDGLLDIIREKHNDTNLAKTVKKNLKEVSKHYKGEFQRMQKLREQGVTGRIEFDGYL